MSGKIKRSQIAAFLNTGTKAVPVWSLIGDGVTEQTIAYNPQTSEEVYISQDSGTTNVESYKVNIPTPMTAIKGDPVFDFVDTIRKNRKVLADAESEVCIVYLYETATAGSYPAERNACSVQIDDFGGPGGETAKINFTLNLNGDPEIGTFNPTTKEFAAA
ncbi:MULTISPECIES: hypothetical protein [Dehalobacter]|uniref:phage tail tube protein n=1 Tax=Dehalobacter TaxID=56112 RepID=UPI002588C044|nr:hypothetical protein [Dehalobacter sp.]MDJ0305391.1 hypothetical protein [Dehalobacter sp.]